MNGGLVLQDVALGGGEHLEDLVLDVLQLLLVLGRLDDQLVLGLLELGLLLGGHDAQQLVLQAQRRDHEVDERDLDGHLGQVVGVAQLGCYVEAEVLRVLDDVLAEAQVLHTFRMQYVILFSDRTI